MHYSALSIRGLNVFFAYDRRFLVYVHLSTTSAAVKQWYGFCSHMSLTLLSCTGTPVVMPL